MMIAKPHYQTVCGGRDDSRESNEEGNTFKEESEVQMCIEETNKEMNNVSVAIMEPTECEDKSLDAPGALVVTKAGMKI